jgi:hypothetical protein
MRLLFGPLFIEGGKFQIQNAGTRACLLRVQTVTVRLAESALCIFTTVSTHQLDRLINTARAAHLPTPLLPPHPTHPHPHIYPRYGLGMMNFTSMDWGLQGEGTYYGHNGLTYGFGSQQVNNFCDMCHFIRSQCVLLCCPQSHSVSAFECTLSVTVCPPSPARSQSQCVRLRMHALGHSVSVCTSMWVVSFHHPLLCLLSRPQSQCARLRMHALGHRVSVCTSMWVVSFSHQILRKVHPQNRHTQNARTPLLYSNQQQKTASTITCITVSRHLSAHTLSLCMSGVLQYRSTQTHTPEPYARQGYNYDLKFSATWVNNWEHWIGPDARGVPNELYTVMCAIVRKHRAAQRAMRDSALVK